MKKVKAIILAAGTGKRMNSSVKKQYMDLLGEPVICHTIRAFDRSDVEEIVLVVGKDDVESIKELIKDRDYSKKVSVVAGGRERYDSVYEGLKCCEDSGYVLVHDGARPIIAIDTINRCIEEVREKKACIVAVRMKDTVKMVSEDGSVESTPDRNVLWSVQTPQAFEYNLLKNAYDKMYRAKDGVDCEKGINITDDAMVIEVFGNEKIWVVEGEYTNIKITTPDDILSAENFLKKVEKKC